jgi:integrase
MSVRKRSWTNAKGEVKTAWNTDYTDQNGRRHIKTFSTKKAADAYHATVVVEVREGRHTPDSQSITVAEAGKHWISTGEGNSLERTTIEYYQCLLDLRILPFLGAVKLSKLTAPMVKEFRSKLLAGTPAPGEEVGTARSPSMVKRVLTALSSILADAHEAGYVAQNVCRSLTNRKKKKSKAQQGRKLRVGVHIPTPDEVKAIARVLEGRWRPLILTALFTGMRASELRGLRWEAIDFDKAELKVVERADRHNAFGAPKSAAGERTVPITPTVLAELRRWKLACPKGPLGLVFPNGSGNVEDLANMVGRGWKPAQIAAGVCTIEKDAEGKVVIDTKGDPIRVAKYSGLHATRHFFAGWCINRRALRRSSKRLPESQVEPALAGHRVVAVFQGIHTVVGEPRRAAPDHNVAMSKLHPCDPIVSSPSAEQELGGKAKRHRHDRSGEIGFIFVLMQTQLRARRVAVDKTRIWQKACEASDGGGSRCKTQEYRGHRRPRIAAEGVLSRIPVPGEIGDPAGRAAIRHRNRHRIAAGRHHVAKRRDRDHGIERRQQFRRGVGCKTAQHRGIASKRNFLPFARGQVEQVVVHWRLGACRCVDHRVGSGIRGSSPATTLEGLRHSTYLAS